MIKIKYYKYEKMDVLVRLLRGFLAPYKTILPSFYFSHYICMGTGIKKSD